MNNLGDRIKAYESAYDFNIIKRVPVIVRVDGKAFSKWTKSIKAKKPFDKQLSIAMAEAMRETASNIEGCMFSYTQSDEITFILRNDQSLESTPWFSNRVQKICSVVSSMVTANFSSWMPGTPKAYFDTRVFAVPDITEAINYLIWRQQNCVKNSIFCATYYEVANKIGRKTTQKMMHGLNQNQQQELLFNKTKVNWNNYPTKFKRGVGCSEVKRSIKINENICKRSAWEINNELPIFTQDRSYLENIFNIMKENKK